MVITRVHWLIFEYFEGHRSSSGTQMNTLSCKVIWCALVKLDINLCRSLGVVFMLVAMQSTCTASKKNSVTIFHQVFHPESSSLWNHVFCVGGFLLWLLDISIFFCLVRRLVSLNPILSQRRRGNASFRWVYIQMKLWNIKQTRHLNSKYLGTFLLWSFSQVLKRWDAHV